MTGTVLFAFGAGMLSTVNPCGFAMLPAFLAYYLGTETGDTAGSSRLAGSASRRAFQGLLAGLFISLGFAGVFTLTGLLVAAGLRSVIGAVPWVAVIIGVVLVAVGVALVSGRHLGVTVNSNRINRAGRGPAAMIAFGGAYAVASLSCTLAVLLAVVAQALATTSLAGTALVFAAYAAGASTVLVLLALSAALASGALANALRRTSRYLPRISGAIVVASGAYLIGYWAPALSTGQPNSSLSRWVAPISASASKLLNTHQGLVAAAALILASFVLAAALWARGTSRELRAGADPADCSDPVEAANQRPTATKP